MKIKHNTLNNKFVNIHEKCQINSLEKQSVLFIHRPDTIREITPISPTHKIPLHVFNPDLKWNCTLHSMSSAFNQALSAKAHNV